MPIDKLRPYLSYIRINFASFRGLLVTVVLTGIIFAAIYKPLLELFGVSYLRWGLVVLLLIEIVAWIVVRKWLPKIPEGKLGLVFALYSEDNLEEIDAKKDFLDQVRKNLVADGLSELVTVVKVPNHIAEKVKNYEIARTINETVHGHYFVFGDVKKRPDGEKEKIFIDLSGLVVHSPIDKNSQFKLSADFVRSLPKEVEMLEEFRFRGFALTADFVYLSAKYIVGIAAFLSGDVNLAITLHERLIDDKLFQRNDLPPNIEEVKIKAKQLLAGSYLLKARMSLLKDDLASYSTFSKRAQSYYPNQYGFHLVRAVELFKEGDAKAAQQEIALAKNLANGAQEWRYSDAFLHYWLSEYDEAYKSSRKIVEHEYSEEWLTIQEVEQFCLNLLETYPDRNQLHFWLGYIAYKKLRDLVKALKYFELFLASVRPDQNILEEKAKTFISDIRSEMGLKE
ncbi:MAG: hypothetical protein HZB70_01985 [Candidatus Berkelbacteria bacterium]|nr:MAG: hypothetical protein HZB70_01985 [Candidatus Berkelbacteria bacterium]QQG51907.1 MAG: hypothetical protein HY845_01010 [Candidatus Berkelbacteria bacterium]